MKLKIFSLLLLVSLFSNALNAGVGNTLVQSISSLNNPIIAGEDVYFQSTVIRSTCNSGFGLFVDFGPYAEPLFFNVGSSSLDFNMTLGPIVFNMPFSGNVRQQLLNSTCNISPDVAEIEINVLPAAIIPTLSQWGMIMVALFLLVFGVITLKSREPNTELG